MVMLQFQEQVGPCTEQLMRNREQVFWKVE